MNSDLIAQFVNEMKERYSEQIAAVSLPDGSEEYIARLISQGAVADVEFLLKLSYLMGMQTGFAAAHAGAQRPEPEPGNGPLQA